MSATRRDARVPAALREHPQWLVWRYEDYDGKRTKVPARPSDPTRRASTTDPSTWATFDKAVEASTGAAGIGFVFSSDDPYTGIDLDDCIDEHGEVEPWAAEVVARLDSYTERSPSGRGLHIIVRAELRGTRRRSGSFEVYDERRFFCMTGERIGEREMIEARQAELDAVVARLLPERELAPTPSGGGLPTGDDRELLDRAFNAKNGAKVEALWQGELNGHASQSEADQALCSMLAFWTGPDAARVDRLFRQSRLMREKWDEQRGDQTYGERTVAKALERRDFYEPPPQRPQERAEGPGEGDDQEAREELTELLCLSDVGLEVTGGRIVGRGSRASADLYLSDSSEVTFETVKEFANPKALSVEMASCTGATPILKVPDALRAVTLLRRISEHRETVTQDLAAVEWGLDYLHAAPTIDVDMQDGADRWRAFCELERYNPRSTAHERAIPLALAGRVLVNTDGTRLVRTGWFHEHARSLDPSAGGNADIAARMERVGWGRRARHGRIKARRPGFGQELVWNFFTVPPDWMARWEGE